MRLLSVIQIVVALACATALAPARAQAQEGTPRVEVGVHFTALRLTEFDKTEPGLGTRATFNLNSHLALEAEINYFTRGLKYITFAMPMGDNVSDKQNQGLFGVKAGWRANRFGVFGKARPGFIHFSKARLPSRCSATDPPGLDCTVGGTTPFALDLGGVFEVYPSPHTVVRFDLGDTMIRYQRWRRDATFSGLQNFISHNVQLHVGVGYRF